MSAMGQVVLSIQEALYNGESREEVAKQLMERYGFGKASALEFIEQVAEGIDDEL